MSDTATELFGPYRIEELLGRGGMGEVHRAFDTEHERYVALKRLPVTASEEFRARFRREAKLVAALSEPHVIPIHAHGEIDGRLYLDMALIEGPDLKRVLADGPLPPARAVEVLGQVAKALDAAHAAGVLHRDVKPANILLDDEGKAYLADFGIARPLAEDATLLTNTGDYIGTLDYMAPERLMRGDSASAADPASDVYSLACVLFQCLTGRVPFPAPDSVGKLSAQLNDPPPAPSLFDRRIPPAMDLVVRTGMDKDPRRRYPSASELMAAAAAVTAEAPTAVQAEATLTGGHFVQLLMTAVAEQEHLPAHAARDDCPYPGLQSFGVRDSGWFYGREQSVRDLLARLSRRREDDGPLLVVGASGAGKSSLLNAGLLAAHTRAGEKALAMTPGDRPIGTLAARLAALTHSDAHQLAQRLWSQPSDFGALCQAAAGERAPLVVAVDQAEELFTQCQDPREREAFATALASAWPARVVLAVRADFVEHCITLPALKPSLDAPYVLGPLTADELARVVTKPAEAAGLELEPGLVDRLITDVGAGRDPGALPRLAHALRETWHNRDGNRLTLNGYQRTGGVDRAVALTADGVYNRLAEPERWALRAALLRMVTLLDGGGIARRRAHRDEVPPRVLESLVAARLVTVDRDTVALSHDALLNAWPRLREWVEEDRQGLLVRQQLAEAAAAWRKSGQDRGDLYRGARLAAALDWGGGRTDLTADERAFLQASDRDRRRTTRRLRGLVAGLATLLVLALVAGVIAVISRGEAEDQRNVALSRQLAAESLAQAQVDPVGAMRKAVDGWRASPTTEARGALLSAPGLTYPSAFRSGLGQGYSIDISHDGRLVAIGSGEGEVALWDMEKRTRLSVDITGAGFIRAVRFSPDGSMLAVSSIDPGNVEESGIRIWSVPEGKLIRRLRHTLNAFGPVSWRPDGAAVAALSLDTDSVARVGEWEPRTGNLNRWIAATGGDVTSLEYSRTGQRLAVGHSTGVLELWIPATATLVVRHDDHTRTAVAEDVPVQVTFSDELLASVSVSDNTIRLWHAETGALVRQFPDVTRHTSDPGQGPSTLAFGSDGTLLYTNSDTTTLTAWDVQTGGYSGTLTPGPRAGTAAGKTVLGIAVSGDGRTKVATTSDGTVLRWHSNANWYVPPLGSVVSVDFSPDGTSLLAGDADGGVESWEAATGRRIASARLDSNVFAVRYTKDGQRITGTADGSFTVTSAQAGFARPRTVRVSGREFRGALAVSPDGRTFAAAHQSPLETDGDIDYKIAVWDVATLEQRAELDLGGKPPYELTFSPDGKRLVAVVSSEGNATVGSDPDGANSATMVSWRAPDFDGEKQVPLDENSLSSLVFTPDGKSILTAGTEGVIQVRDAVTGEIRGSGFGSHSSTVRDIAISPDGRRVATVTVEDPVVRLWDLPGRKLLAVLTGHSASLNEVVFSPDGTMLASGGTDTDVGVWRLDPDAVVRQVCANLADAGEDDLGSLGC